MLQAPGHRRLQDRGNPGEAKTLETNMATVPCKAARRANTVQQIKKIEIRIPSRTTKLYQRRPNI